MSVMYCEHCHMQVDTDRHPEHFNDDGDCVEWLLADVTCEDCKEAILDGYSGCGDCLYEPDYNAVTARERQELAQREKDKLR